MRARGATAAIAATSGCKPVEPPVKYIASSCSGFSPASASASRAAPTMRSRSAAIDSIACDSRSSVARPGSTTFKSIGAAGTVDTAILASSARAASAWPSRLLRMVISRACSRSSAYQSRMPRHSSTRAGV